MSNYHQESVSEMSELKKTRIKSNQINDEHGYSGINFMSF